MDLDLCQDCWECLTEVGAYVVELDDQQHEQLLALRQQSLSAVPEDVFRATLATVATLQTDPLVMELFRANLARARDTDKP